jgi:hypothetical protein
MWINSGRAHGARNKRHYEHQAQHLAIGSVLRLDRHSAGCRHVRCDAVRPPQLAVSFLFHGPSKFQMVAARRDQHHAQDDAAADAPK